MELVASLFNPSKPIIYLSLPQIIRNGELGRRVVSIVGLPETIRPTTSDTLIDRPLPIGFPHQSPAGFGTGLNNTLRIANQGSDRYHSGITVAHPVGERLNLSATEVGSHLANERRVTKVQESLTTVARLVCTAGVLP